MNANPIQKTNPGMNDAILQVDHLSMKFGGLVAIGDLSFAARRGEITALIGPNGAGKTTVFNCITGFYKPSEGMITLNRADGSSFLLERLPNHEIPARAKVARCGGLRAAPHVAAQASDQRECRLHLLGRKAFEQTLLAPAHDDIQGIEQRPPLVGQVDLDATRVVAAQDPPYVVFLLHAHQCAAQG